MQSPRISIAATSPLRAAWRHILQSVLSFPTENISDGCDSFKVITTGSAAAFLGELSILAALRQSAAAPEHATFLGVDGGMETRLLVNQWVVMASRIAADAESVDGAVDEAEKYLALHFTGKSAEFLCATPRATIADVLMYAALPNDTVLTRLPSLSRWARHAVSDSYVAPLARSHQNTTGVTPAVAAPQQTGDAPARAAPQASTFVKPTAEEIERRRLEKEKAKVEKEKAKAADLSSSAPSTAKPKGAAIVSTALDIRVGRITSIARHPEADKLYVESIDMGTETRTIVSGLVDHYTADELLGKLVLVVCNLKPKPLKGVTSHGMVLCASTDKALRIVSPGESTVAGERVAFGGQLADPAPEAMSNTISGELLSHLRTDSNGAVVWKDEPASVSAGIITSTLCNAVVK